MRPTLIKSLIPYSVIRYFYLVLFYLKHKKVKVDHGCFIHPTVSIGKNVYIGVNSSLYNVRIGSNTYCSRDCNLSNMIIGSYCSIGGWCKAGLGSHPTNTVATSPIFYSNLGILPAFCADRSYYQGFKTIIIQNNVLISANVTILDGVTIGEGAICAAGAVVNRDVLPYSIVGGVPAKLIKYRFDENIIDQLLKMKIFEKGDDWLKMNLTGLVKPEDLLNSNKFSRN